MRPGVLLHSATERGNRELVGLMASLRAPLPVSRRVGFVSLTGGTGCSSTAGQVAALLAGHRAGTVLVVDAAHAGPALPSRIPEASGLVRVRLEGRSGTGDPHADKVEQWRSEVGEAHRDHDLTLTDWGPCR